MLEKIPNLPGNAIGFTAKRMVTARDYESVIMPAVEALFSHYKKVRLLYHLGEDFAGFEVAAMWDDAKLGLKHLAGWERIAVVSDVGWIRVAIRAFGVVMPAQVRVFREKELADATRWISE
ncbi:MAG: STAS/SEC14 domain-containing protein [Casimicrobiaceae bacterium]